MTQQELEIQSNERGAIKLARYEMALEAIVEVYKTYGINNKDSVMHNIAYKALANKE